MKLISRNLPLTTPQKEEFFRDHGHLSYRYTMLLAHKERVDKKKPMEYALQICAFEAALIACRMFMNFLGLGTSYSPKLILIKRQDYFNREGKTDEVKVVDLGGDFVDLNSLSEDEKDLLAKVYHMASKSTAHFTYRSEPISKPEYLGKGIELIDRLLKKHLYDVVKRPIKKHS